MITKRYPFTLSALICALCISGCTPSHQASQLTPLQLKSQKAWHAVSGYGLEVDFNQPVTSVVWTFDGNTKTTRVEKPKITVLLPLKLKPSAPFSVTIDTAKGPQAIAMKPVHLRGKMPEPLTLSTNPGIWQFNVPRSGPFTLNFSLPIANQTNIEKDVHFNPSVPFHVVWQSNQTAELIPNQPLNWTQTETLTVQGGLSGPRSTTGQYLLDSSISRPFITQSDEQIVVTEKYPQTLTLYRNGHVVLKSLCNTGVMGATTPPGNYYVHVKLPKDTMKGVNPDGTKYDDKDVPWVMQLFGNTAIHGYPRTHYGFPQSNGCVELPISVAKKLYGLINIGTPVTIKGADS
jgi:lipoprotein-anchoring transpeptidase ErfK/SrfK